MSKPYIVRVSSQKGGVGKTTIATNLATAIRNSGYKVLLVDFDFSNPSVGFHLGLQDVNSGVHAVLTKRAKLQNVVAIHEPTGLHVLPAEIRDAPTLPSVKLTTDFLNQLKKTSYNFIVMDTSPGYYPDVAMSHFNEDIIVATPDIAACASAVRLSKRYDKAHLKHSLVLNKARNTRFELSYREVADMYGNEINGSLPADDAVPASIAAHVPAYVLKPKSKFSRAFEEVSYKYVDRAGVEGVHDVNRGGLIKALLALFSRKKH